MGGHSHDAHHGHGHHAPTHHKSVINYDIPEPAHPVADFKAPDWRLYKVENAPELVSVQNRLAARGLKDPWLRNEVWRFDPQFGSMSKRPLMLKSASTGMKLGFILFVGAVILETGYNRLFGKKDHHGHH